MSDAQANAASFIKGSPLRKPEYFIGPVAWWNGSLTCGGVERQILASAKAFQDKGTPIVLLCRTLSAAGGNDFFLAEAKNCCKAVLEFSLDKIKVEDFQAARGVVDAAFENPPPVFRDSVAVYAAWFLRLMPRLLHIWNADHLEPLLAAIIAGVPNIIIAGRSLAPRSRAPYGFESVDESLAHAILSRAVQMPGVVMTNNSRAGCIDYEEWLNLPAGSVSLTSNILRLKDWPCPEPENVAALRIKLGIPEKSPVVGGLIRFVSIKDPELWICTAMRVCAANPGLYAVLAGHGPMYEQLKNVVASTAHADRILLPGAIKNVSDFLSLCSVFLHTAYVEGLPNALLEAHALGVPIVTTRCGGAADVVVHGQSGFVLDGRDEVALANHVGWLSRHPEAARAAGQTGRVHVGRDFSLEHSLGQLQVVYDRITGKTAKRCDSQCVC
ncbi:glycosyltransferase [Desulfovibrio intestinalis]|uniref:Glycosyltransferase involved in cell wall biosynthesis n=1 Tax=Desulfovibrio intestinalis TaxID=58621 RepID=A0A7W8FEA6_9BACT|nr:glycosyltransferase [Desulfovibrio intestinalis]MBB5143554.1 glycosyltransferase involved in cell wall biosynthesis [Desulfovibrio intestinalis]